MSQVKAPLVIDDSNANNPYPVDSSSTLTEPSIVVGATGNGELDVNGGMVDTGSLDVGQTSGSSGTVNQTGGTVDDDAIIGDAGTGTYTNNDGMHYVSGSLILGNQSTGNGTYTISGISASTTTAFTDLGGATPNYDSTVGPITPPNGALIVGLDGVGSFTQGLADGSDPTNTVTVVGDLVLGEGDIAFGQGTDPTDQGTNSVGTYTLNDGTLTVDGKAVIGARSTNNNVFTQNGGTVDITGSNAGNSNYVGVGNTTTNELLIGGGGGGIDGGTGTYNMTGGLLETFLVEDGHLGTGSFNQSGGTVNIQWLWVANASGNDQGNYALSGGTLETVSEQVGLGGTGIFTQSGTSTNTLNGTLAISSFGGNGSYDFTGGSFTISGDADIGQGGGGLGTFDLGGTAALGLGGNLSIGTNAGSDGVFNYNQNSGDTGTIAFQNSGQDIYVGDGGTGIFNQYNNDLNLGVTSTDLDIGHYRGSTGTYNLLGGTLEALNITVGDNGNGTFNQNTSGTTVTVGDLFLGLNSLNGFGTGIYNLSDGTLSAGNEYIGISSGGIVDQTGGNNTVTGTIDLERSGVYELAGGSVSASGGITNNGEIFVSGGESIGDAISGNGTIVLDPGAALTLGSSVASSENIDFVTNATDTLNADFSGGPTEMSGQIINFVNGDAINLNGLGNLAGATLSYADNGNGTGTLSVLQGTTTVASLNFVGTYQTTDFQLNGTTLTTGFASPDLIVDVSTNPLYTVTNTTLTVPRNVIVGLYGYGTFNQGDGSNSSVVNVTNELAIAVGGTTLSGGVGSGNPNPGYAGIYNITDGSLNVGAGISVGGSPDLTTPGNAIFGGVGLLNQTGGDVSTGTNVTVGANGGNGIYNQTGGTLTANTGMDVGLNTGTGPGGFGTFSESGGGTTATLGSFGQSPTAFDLLIGADPTNSGGFAEGFVNLSGGALLTVYGNADLGQGSGSSGTMSIGTAGLSGPDSTDVIITADTNGLDGNLTVGDQGTGTLNIASGFLSVYNDLTLDGLGNGTVNQTGGLTTVGVYYDGQILPDGNSYNANDGLLVIGATGFVPSGIGPIPPDDTYNLGATGQTATTPWAGYPSSGNSVSYDSSVDAPYLTVYGDTIIGRDTYSNGIFNLAGDGSTFNSNAVQSGVNSNTGFGGNLTVGQNGNGTFNQTDQTIVYLDGSLDLGQGSGSSGAYNLTATSLTGSNSGSPNLSVGAGLTVGDAGSGTFTQGSGDVLVNGSIDIGLQSGSAGNYTISSGTLTVTNNINVGDAGTGTFTQSGSAAVTVDGSITLVADDFTNNSGTYNIEGGTLSVGNFTVGYGAGDPGPSTASLGTVNQSAGAVTAQSIALGNGGSTPNSVGIYNLTGTGTIVVSSSEDIGEFGNGTFNQGDGNGTTTNTINGTLDLGTGQIATPDVPTYPREGTYNLTDGALIAQTIIVGDTGRGLFNQSGGSVTASQGLDIGNQYTTPSTGGTPIFGGASTGTYNLTGGTLTVESGNSSSPAFTFVGAAGDGTFVNDGATDNTDVLVIAQQDGSTGIYTLKDGGALNITNGGFLDVGENGGATFEQDTGTTTVTGSSDFGRYSTGIGTVYIHGGTFTEDTFMKVGDSGSSTVTQDSQDGSSNVQIAQSLDIGLLTGSHGSYDISGTSTLAVNGGPLNVGNQGTGSLTIGTVGGPGGTNVIVDGTAIGDDLNVGAFGSGTLTIHSGNLSVSNNLNVGANGQGTVIQDGGSVTTNFLDMSIFNSVPLGSSTYTMSGGTLLANSDIFIGGPGSSVTSTFTESGSASVGTSTLTVNASGVYDFFGGSLGVSGFDDNGLLVTSGTNTLNTGALYGNGALDLQSGADFTVSTTIASSVGINFESGTETLNVGGQVGTLGVISGFVNGDVINLTNMNLTADSAQFDYTSDVLTITNASNAVVATLDFTGNYTGETFQLAQDGVSSITVTCFYPGTKVRTPSGEGAVEDLAVGDLVATLDGTARAVRWVGRQTVSTRFGDPLRVLPIRIRQGALGENLPVRDLLVSPDHALLIDGVLVHAGALVNGTSITRERDVPEIFTYYHVELDDHALLLAEGVAAESFIDNVDRMNFDNWAEHEALYPNGYEVAEMPYPRVKSVRQLPSAIRKRLAAQAA